MDTGGLCRLYTACCYTSLCDRLLEHWYRLDSIPVSLMTDVCHHLATLPAPARNMNGTLRARLCHSEECVTDVDTYRSCLRTLHSQTVVEVKPNFVLKRVLGASPPDISPLESLLPESVHTTLAQLHSDHCRLLNTYKACITSSISDQMCGVAPHSVGHLFNCWNHRTQLTVQDLSVWDNPATVTDFLTLTICNKRWVDSCVSCWLVLLLWCFFTVGWWPEGHLACKNPAAWFSISDVVLLGSTQDKLDWLDKCCCLLHQVISHLLNGFAYSWFIHVQLLFDSIDMLCNEILQLGLCPWSRFRALDLRPNISVIGIIVCVIILHNSVPLDVEKNTTFMLCSYNLQVLHVMQWNFFSSLLIDNI